MSIVSEIQRIKTNIANAYTQAGNKGATLPQSQNSANLADTISSITTGGGTTIEEKDVNFYDYDGTLLYSYTLAEVQALTELPELPSHDGLICQGWNWTLADIKAEGKEKDVGAMYITNNGRTRLYINLEERLSPTCKFNASANSEINIFWGDGEVTNITTEEAQTVSSTHEYEAGGDYVIELEVLSGTITIENDIAYSCILYDAVNGNRVYQNSIKHIQLGSNVTLGKYAFAYCYSLTNITVPSGVSNIGQYAFGYCYSLTNITVPSGVTSIEKYAFAYCYLLAKITMPNSVTSIKGNAFYCCYSLIRIDIPSKITSIEDYVFQNCYSLTKITISNRATSIKARAFDSCYSLTSVIIGNRVTNIGDYVFQNCCSLAKITIPNGVTSIGSYAFDYCHSLESIIMPNSVTSIKSNAFYYCTAAVYYDFTACTSVPTLSNTSVFYNIPSDCKIIVPDALYDNWIVATNWSTYASYIIKETDWEASQV